MNTLLDFSQPELRARNEERAKKLIDELGPRYACSPFNRVQRKLGRELALPTWIGHWMVLK